MNKILSTLGLAVLGVAILVGAATAATTGTTAIGATLGASYAITAPEAVTGWALGIGTNEHDSSTAGTVSANSAWKVQVSEASGDGQLASTETSTDKLAAIHASSDEFASSDVTMSATAQTIATGLATASTNLNIDYRQTVAYDDVKHNDYTMTLTYAVSAST